MRGGATRRCNRALCGPLRWRTGPSCTRRCRHKWCRRRCTRSGRRSCACLGSGDQSVRGVHTEFISQFPTGIMYSDSLTGSGEAAKGSKKTLDTPACASVKSNPPIVLRMIWCYRQAVHLGKTKLRSEGIGGRSSGMQDSLILEARAARLFSRALAVCLYSHALVLL